MRKIRAVRFAEDNLYGFNAYTSCTISGHVPTTRAHLLLKIRRLIFIKASLRGHVSLHDMPSAQLNRDRLMSLKRLTALNYARALIVIAWTGVHEINARRSMQFNLMHHALPRRL